jgi:GYF domain 2
LHPPRRGTSLGLPLRFSGNFADVYEVRHVTSKWYYLHEKSVRGPFDAETLRRHAASGDLQRADLLWLAGEDPMTAVRAEAALAFPAEPTTVPLPDWVRELAHVLADVDDPAKMSSPTPAAWLEDVSRHEQAEKRRG